ncbi:MAG: D-glycero-beta-D-manno-heptose 1-phosphate adenylyltransferase [Chloroflexota bacterium]
MGKVLSRTELGLVVESLRAAGKKLVFTNGVFDLLHPGHVRYLTAARALGDVLIVGLNSDASVRRIKGPGRPIQDEASRAEVLAALGSVDFVVIFDEDTAAELVKFIRPDVYVKGGDYAGVGPDRWPEAEVVRAYGGEVRTLEFAPGYSTSEIIRKIMERHG